MSRLSFEKGQVGHLFFQGLIVAVSLGLLVLLDIDLRRTYALVGTLMFRH